IDVQTIEATRWHDLYVDQLEEDDEKQRRDVFLSWQCAPDEIASRSNRAHPHLNWSLWAHPPVASNQAPAIRVNVKTDIVPVEEDFDEERSLTVDVALASFSVSLDALLAEGFSRFISD